MIKNIDKNLLNKLKDENKSLNEIYKITGYSKNSIYGYYYRNFGKGVLKKESKQILEISNLQREVLFGILLGDSNLTYNGYSYIGRNNHSIKQEIYCKHKIKLLNGLVSKISYTTIIVNNKNYDTCYFSFKANENLKEFYEMFYDTGKRDVPKDLSLLTPLAMAMWFMDDGTARSGCTISIATCSFSSEGLNRLQKHLKKVYKLDTKITKENKLDFTAKSGKRFYELVVKYIIPEMMYKFKDLNF